MITGTRPLRITSRLPNLVSTRRPGGGWNVSAAAPLPSVVDIEIHPRIEACDLIAVAVEHQRLAAAGLADPLLGRLAPPRVIVIGIDVREEPVLPGGLANPGRRWLTIRERDLDDRLDALEYILPGRHQAHRGAVLRRQLLAVEPGREQRERVHRLVDPQALDIGPLEDVGALVRHALGIVQGLE